MADDRPADDPNQAIANLQRRLDDMERVAAATAARSPTGDVEMTIRRTPKDGTLFLNGDNVSRETYRGLYEWVVAQDLIATGLFTTGNGSTTFGLPDLRGRVPVGVGTLGSDVYALGALGGATTRSLTAAQLPAHTHTATTSADSHNHGGTTGNDTTSHQHGTHYHDVVGGVAFNQGSGTAPSNPIGGNTGNATAGHVHNFTTGTDSHSHTLTTASAGSGAAVDIRAPYMAVNWLIWT